MVSMKLSVDGQFFNNFYIIRLMPLILSIISDLE